MTLLLLLLAGCKQDIEDLLDDSCRERFDIEEEVVVECGSPLVIRRRLVCSRICRSSESSLAAVAMYLVGASQWSVDELEIMNVQSLN